MPSSNMTLRTKVIRQRWPNRNVLVPKSPLMHSQKGRSQKGKVVKKDDSLAISRQPPELTPEQLQLVEHLTNIDPHRPCPVEEIVEKPMEKSPSSLHSANPASMPSPLFSLPSTTSTPQHSGVFGWEPDAARIISERNLRLFDSWSSFTWKNKTNMHVRLKLLKDDGYDITPLLRKGVSSDEVTEALLAHVQARNKQNSADGSSAGQKRDIEDESEDPRLIVNGKDNIEPVVIFESAPVSRESEDRPRSRLFLIPQKRKLCYDEERGNDEHPLAQQHGTVGIQSPLLAQCAHGPPTKKARLLAPEELQKGTEEDAFRKFRKNIRHKIFQGSRAAQQGFEAEHPTPQSSIVFIPSDPSPKPRTMADAYVGTRGLAYILDELRSFADCQDDGSAIFLCDPETCRGKEAHKSCQYCICIRGSLEHTLIMQGNAKALAGLMQRLRTQDLIHTSKWLFNGMEVVPVSNMFWSLSNDTEKALHSIERKLQTGVAGGGVEVRVEQIYNGKKRRYDCY